MSPPDAIGCIYIWYPKFSIQSNASFESLPEIEGMNDMHENQTEETENNEEN